MRREEGSSTSEGRYYRSFTSGTTAERHYRNPRRPRAPLREKFGKKYAQGRYYRWLTERHYRPSGTTAHYERYYHPSGTTAFQGAVLPAMRDGFQPELPPVVSLRPNYYI